MQISGVSQSIRPKGKMEGSWPSLSGVEQLFSSALGEVADGLLGNPNLEMGVDAAEGESLTGLLACRLKIVVSKAAVIAVVMFDANAVLIGESFEGMFCGDGFLGGQFRHEMDVLEAGEVIDKNRGGLVLLLR